MELVEEAQPRRPSTMLSNNNGGPVLMSQAIRLEDGERAASNEAN